MLTARINKLAPVETAVIERDNQCFRCGNIRCKRHVVNVAETEQGIFVIVNILHGICAAEIKYYVDFIVCDS